jgi:hypothetical protein
MDSQEIRDKLWRSDSFREDFQNANEGLDRRNVIIDHIERIFGREARRDSLIAERREMEVYFARRLNGDEPAATSAVQTATQLNQEIIMNQSAPAIEQKIFIFGQNAKDVADDQIFAHVANLEAQIEHLNKTQNKSKKLEAKIASLQADIDNLNAFVDTRD